MYILTIEIVSEALYCVIFGQSCTFSFCIMPHRKMWIKRLCVCVCSRLSHDLITLNTHTHSRFMALFPGPPGWAGARRELLDFMVQGEINRGRHTDHPAGRHSSGTSQCPPAPSTHIFCGPDALPAAQPTVSKHWRQNVITLKGTWKCHWILSICLCHIGISLKWLCILMPIVVRIIH